MINTATVFEPLALNSLERYVQKDIGSHFLVSLTDRQYDSPEHYISETKSFGFVSKRIPYLPKGFRVGFSRIFLSFFWVKDENQVRQNSIFGYFVGDGVDLIVPSSMDEIERYRMFASIPEFVLIPEVMAKKEPSRVTGPREAGQIFVTSKPDSDLLISDQSKSASSFIESVDAGLAVFRTPIPYHGEYFRTIKNFDPLDYGIPFGVEPPSSDSILNKAKKYYDRIVIDVA